MPSGNSRPVIVDVHTHIFNAWDIPLEGYLRSRQELRQFELIKRWFIKRVISKCIRGDKPPEPSPNPGLPENFHCWLLRRTFPPGYMRWAHILGMNVVNIAERLKETYPSYRLFVPLMVDYEYWFDSTKDVLIDAQVDEIHQKIIVPFGGLIHPFVSFDPARQLAFEGHYPNPDGRLETINPLALVEDAIQNKGFIGIKLYNSLGYRPFWNAEVETQRRKIALHGTRYKNFTGADYDRVLRRLYQFCVDNGVPITTHCHSTGIEAYKGASEVFGEPRLWWPVMELYPELHLNLAHFGWYRKNGEGYQGRNSWVKEICTQFSAYPHLYADVAHHDVVVKGKKERFIRDYRDLLREHPDAKKRMLFGTDWHVFIREERYRDMHTEYEDVLRQAGGLTDGEISDFLGGNALRFLGLLPGDQNRQRLAKFYQDHNIPPPEWFRMTEPPNG
ncbi:amidohydrolase [bacterium]|nr:amidohydrolase [bacterium]MBU1984096.1 amidohydrolase [bacterium]